MLLLLADPTFTVDAGNDTLRLRLLDGSTPILDKDFTNLGTVSTGIEKSTGATTYTLKTLDDPAATDRLRSFLYKSLERRRCGRDDHKLVGNRHVGV